MWRAQEIAGGWVQIKRFSALCFAAPFYFALMFPPLAYAAPPAEGVLIIHSNQRVLPAAIIVENTIRKQVPDALQRPVEFYSEYLDTEWASRDVYAEAQAEFLRQKYSGRNIRVVVAVVPQALYFMTRFREHMFPAVPIVHIAIPVDQIQAELPVDIVGRTIDLDPTPTLQLALLLHPNANRLVVVLGATERDRIWEARIRKAVQKLEKHHQVEYLIGLKTDEVVHRLRGLNKNVIVYSPGYFVDGAGKVTTPRQSMELIGAASAAPLYGPYDTFFGTGMVGGYMATYEFQAKQAGDMVTQLLNGVQAATLPTSSLTKVPVVDWRMLRRWGIDESLLPADTVVRFREPTVWDKYRTEISIGIAILLVQVAWILALLIERRSRRRVSAALEESQTRMSLAAQAAGLSMWIWDVSRDKIWTAPRAQAGEQPIAFKDVLERAHPADREQLEQAVNDALEKGEEIDTEYRVLEPDGEVRWVAARGRAEKDGTTLVLGVAIDITDRKRAELRAVEDRNALRHMTRVSMLGQLSASIAHQLNQPLAAILGNAEAARKMLARENFDLNELREICDDIVSEDNRAAEVIRRLGALYKRGEMKMESIDLNALILETLELLRAELLIRHVTPVTDLESQLPGIEGGSVQLQQVLLNLMLNAADAMNGVKEEDRLLTIRTQTSGTEIRMYMIDKGSGIASTDLPHIFDAFWSTKEGGMGIGLAICQSIIEAHHGSMSAANNPEGGAIFCVSLPLEPQP